MLVRVISIAFLLVGCAKAGKEYVQIGGGDVDGGFGHGGDDGIDAPERPPIDAPPHIDAGGGMISSTLTETTDSNIDDNDAIYCPNQLFGGTGDDSYYRIFEPSLSGITGTFQVTDVAFGVWAAVNATGVSVSVGTYPGPIDGNLDTTQITNLATQGANVPDTNVGETVSVAIDATIPAGGLFVVTVTAPELAPDGFALGMSASAESHPGYVSSNNCSQPVVKTTAIGAGALIINVTGSH